MRYEISIKREDGSLASYTAGTFEELSDKCCALGTDVTLTVNGSPRRVIGLGYELVFEDDPRSTESKPAV